MLLHTPFSLASTASCSSPLVATALPPCGPRSPVEVRERAAGLAHQDVERRDVPQLDLRLGGDVDGTLGHQAVGPEVAVAAHPPHRVGELDELVAQPESAQPVIRSGERQAGRAEVVDTGHRELPRAPPPKRRERALAVARPTIGGPARARSRRRRPGRRRPAARSAWPTPVRRGRSSWCRRSGRSPTACP